MKPLVGFYPSPPPRIIEKAKPDDVVYEHEGKEFSLIVFGDGLVALHVVALEPLSPGMEMDAGIANWTQYAHCLNAAHLLLDSATMREMNLAAFELYAITGQNALRRTADGGFVLPPTGDAQSKILNRYCLDPAIRATLPRVWITEDVLNVCAADLDVVLPEKELRDTLSLISKSIAEYKTYEWETALLLSWLVVEEEIRALWQKHIDGCDTTYTDGSKRINADRRSNLTESPDWSVSVVSNVLELCDALSLKCFREISQVRTWRNQIVHTKQDRYISAQEAQRAIRLAVELAVAGRQLSITPNLNYSLRGP